MARIQKAPHLIEFNRGTVSFTPLRFIALDIPEWTEFEDARLMDLVAEGLSFSQIGARMGMTRNAASGRFNRITRKMGAQAK